MTSTPPRLASVLLSRIDADRDALAGDLLEEFQLGRSRTWLWCQILAALGAQVVRSRRCLTLGLDERSFERVQPLPIAPRSDVNLTGIGTRHVGGLGVVAIGVFAAIVVPQIWWLLLWIGAGGIVLGAALAIIERRRLGRRGASSGRVLLSVAILLLVGTPLVRGHQNAANAGRAVPLDPIEGIFDAYRSHRIVMLPGGFGAARRALLYSLMRDPRFPLTVNDIVVEFGSSRYQDAMDRFVRGDDVPYEVLRRAWQDTPRPPGNDSPPEEEFYHAVREINASLPRDRRIRVLLGEPPIDWDHVRTKEDLRKWTVIRDIHTGDLIRREVLVRNRRALVLYGQLHYARKEILTNYDMSDWQAQTMVSWLEATPGTKAFTIWADDAGVRKIEPAASAWPQMRLLLLRGTALGAADFTEFDPGTGPDRYVIRGIDDFAKIPRDQFHSLRMDEQFDAILYTGGGVPDPPIPRVSPRACADPGYLEMRLARIALAGLPPSEGEGVRKACAAHTGNTATASPFTGLWTAELSKSKLHANSPLRAATLQFEVTRDTVSITDRAQNVSGQEIGTGTNTFRTDGNPYPHDALLPGLSVVAKWRTSRALETILTRKTGEIDRVTYEVSDDGKLLTTRTSGKLGDQMILFYRVTANRD